MNKPFKLIKVLLFSTLFMTSVSASDEREGVFLGLELGAVFLEKETAFSQYGAKGRYYNESPLGFFH